MTASARVESWDKIATDRPMALIERQRVIGEKMMVSRVVLRKGFLVASHSHHNEQISIIVSGRVRFELGTPGAADHRFEVLGAGQVVVLPPHVAHGAEAIEETVILDLFSPPSETTGVDKRH